MSLLRVDSFLDKLSKSLYRDVPILTTICGLISDDPSEDIFIGIEPTLLICDVVTLATLLVKLREAICRVLEGVLQSFKMQLS